MAIRILLLHILLLLSFKSIAVDSLTIFNILKKDTTNYNISGDTLSAKYPADESWHIEKGEGINADFLNTDGEEWKFYLLIFIALLIGITRLAYYKDFKELIDAFLNFNLANQFYRDWEASPPFSFLLFNLVYLLVLSLSILLILDYYHINIMENELISLLIIFAGLLALFILRVVFYRLLNIIFSFGRELRLYSFHIGVIYKILGLTLFPLVILFTFITESYAFIVAPILIVVIFSFLFYRYLRGFAIANEYIRFYRFHFLLYICTLEIAPVLIFVKIITKYIH